MVIRKQADAAAETHAKWIIYCKLSKSSDEKRHTLRSIFLSPHWLKTSNTLPRDMRIQMLWCASEGFGVLLKMVTDTLSKYKRRDCFCHWVLFCAMMSGITQ